MEAGKEGGEQEKVEEVATEGEKKEEKKAGKGALESPEKDEVRGAPGCSRCLADLDNPTLWSTSC